jgi:hypothetical protein
VQVRAGVNSPESGSEASNWVLHIITKDGFELSHLEFASAWVADEFMAKALQEDCEGLATLVAHTEGAFSGHLFEALMHHLLPQVSWPVVSCLQRLTFDSLVGAVVVDVPAAIAEVKTVHRAAHADVRQGGEFTVMPIDATSLDRGDEEPLNLPSCGSKKIFKVTSSQASYQT